MAKINVTTPDDNEPAPEVIAPQPPKPAISASAPSHEPPLEHLSAPAKPPTAAAPADIPRFGELQPKIDNHPLFSGTREPAPKNRRWLKRTLAPLSVLMVLAIVGYLLIDSGIVRGYSHLPFHVFKAPPVASTPVITPVKTSQTTVDPYAGWKTYIVPEDQTISFRYPADWTIRSDARDTTTTPYNRFVKIVDPTQYHSDYFLLKFYYSPGTQNFLNVCSNVQKLGVVSSDAFSVSSTKLMLLTEAGEYNGIKTTGVALSDLNYCNVKTASGVISISSGYGLESAPNYSIDLSTWNSLPESSTFRKIIESIKF